MLGLIPKKVVNKKACTNLSILSSGDSASEEGEVVATLIKSLPARPEGALEDCCASRYFLISRLTIAVRVKNTSRKVDASTANGKRSRKVCSKNQAWGH